MRKFILLSSLILITTFVFAQAKITMKPTRELTVTSSVEVASFDRSRRYIMIQNKGPFDVVLKYDTVHDNNEGFILRAGGSYRPEIIPINPIFIKSLAGQVTIVVQEGF